MQRLEEGHGSDPGTLPIEPSRDVRQRRRMVAALAMLLLALVLVVIRNRQYFYPGSSATDQDGTAQAPPDIQPKPPAVADLPPTAPSVETRPVKPTLRPRSSPTARTPIQPAGSPAFVATDRAVLPALQVEVVAGDSHRTVQPGNNSIKVEMQPAGSASDKLPGDTETAATSATVEASERVRLSPDASKLVTHQVTPDYPLLAKQMKVQGAVILQALIGKEGTIQDLQVLSGPAILSSAAREAVKQWRFKPYYQSGQAVETQARITVNFTISTY